MIRLYELTICFILSLILQFYLVEFIQSTDTKILYTVAPFVNFLSSPVDVYSNFHVIEKKKKKK